MIDAVFWINLVAFFAATLLDIYADERISRWVEARLRATYVVWEVLTIASVFMYVVHGGWRLATL